MNPTFTLQSIRDAGPCGIKRGEKGGWNKLLIGLGYSPGNYPKTALVSLGDVADINDAADSLWCIRCLDWSDAAVCRAVIAGAVMPAVKRAAKFTKDQRVHACIAAIDKWLGGDDTVDLITAARAAAGAARAAEAAGAAEAAARAARAAAEAAREAGAAGAARAARAARAAGAAAEAARAAWAALAARAAEAAGAAEAAEVAWEAAEAAGAAEAAEAARAAEAAGREQLRADIIAAFPRLGGRWHKKAAKP